MDWELWACIWMVRGTTLENVRKPNLGPDSILWKVSILIWRRKFKFKQQKSASKCSLKWKHDTIHWSPSLSNCYISTFKFLSLQFHLQVRTLFYRVLPSKVFISLSDRNDNPTIISSHRTVIINITINITKVDFFLRILNINFQFGKNFKHKFSIWK